MFGASWYGRKALRGEIKPHLVTFFLWALAPLVAFAAQVSSGAGATSLLTLVVGVNPAIIFSISIRRPDAHWSVSTFDVVCGALSLIGLGLWLSLRDAQLAVALSIVADGLASAPTYRKVLVDPYSESVVLYLCLLVSCTITLLTIEEWHFTNYGFVVYLALIGLSLTALIAIGRRRYRRSALRAEDMDEADLQDTP
jgi:hypothetical protein